MYVSSLKEISVGESVTEYLLGNASSGLHISLIAMLPKGEVIVITYCECLWTGACTLPLKNEVLRFHGS